MSDEKVFAPTARAEGLRRPRRRFLAGALGLGAGLAALGRGRRSMAQQPAVTDPAILNFALNFEYLGAEYYTYALTGSSIEALGIPTTGSGTPGPVTIKADPKVPFASAAIMQFAADLALDEQRHTLYVRKVLAQLGVQPIARPAIDLLNSYNALAKAAGLPTPFDPFADDTNFLLGAYILEDVCVTALHGAAPLLRNKTVLAGAAGLLGVEAYQAAMIRTNLYQLMQGTPTEAISALRLKLGGSVDYGVAQGPLDDGPAGNSSIVLADGNALVGSRTTREVLNIAYGAINAESGGFFPAGVNGPIH